MTEHIHCFLKNLASSETDGQEATVRLLILQAPPWYVQLCCPEVGMAEVTRLGHDAWVAFRRLFTHLLVNGQRPHYGIHASCVTDCNGCAGLVVGPSNAGKTCLLTALLRRGHQLVCDDYAILHLERRQVLALPVGVTMTTKSFSLFPDLEHLKRHACKFRSRRQWQWTVNLGEVYPCAAPFTEFTPRCLFFTHANFGGESHVTECSREEALWWLQIGQIQNPAVVAASSESEIRYQRRCFDLAQHLLATTRFFRALNGDIERTADLIEAAFNE